MGRKRKCSQHVPLTPEVSHRGQLFCANCLSKGKPTKIQLCNVCGDFHTTHNFGRESAVCSDGGSGPAAPPALLDLKSLRSLVAPPLAAPLPSFSSSSSSCSSDDNSDTEGELLPPPTPLTLPRPSAVARTTTFERAEAVLAATVAHNKGGQGALGNGDFHFASATKHTGGGPTAAAGLCSSGASGGAPPAVGPPPRVAGKRPATKSPFDAASAASALLALATNLIDAAKSSFDDERFGGSTSAPGPSSKSPPLVGAPGSLQLCGRHPSSGHAQPLGAALASPTATRATARPHPSAPAGSWDEGGLKLGGGKRPRHESPVRISSSALSPLSPLQLNSSAFRPLGEQSATLSAVM